MKNECLTVDRHCGNCLTAETLVKQLLGQQCFRTDKTRMAGEENRITLISPISNPAEETVTLIQYRTQYTVTLTWLNANLEIGCKRLNSLKPIINHHLGIGVNK